MEPTYASKLAEMGRQLFREALNIDNTPAPNDDDLDTPPVTPPTPPKLRRATSVQRKQWFGVN